MIKRTLKTQQIKDTNVESRNEEWKMKQSEPWTPMRSAYNIEGHYIGNAQHFRHLHNKYGIRHFERAHPKHDTCSIGFNPETKTWYGWSHRAISGFTIGSKTKNKQARTLGEAKRMAREFAESVS